MNKLTSWLRKPLLLASIVPLLAVVGGVLPIPGAGVVTAPLASRLAVAPEVPPTPGPRLTPVDTCIGMDDSGSEYGPGGTDPGGLRYSAARSAITWLREVTVSDAPNRVALVHFGSTAPSSMVTQLTAVTQQNVPTLMEGLTAPATSLQETNFEAVIGRCQELLSTGVAGRSQAILIFTDGAPDMGNGPTAGLFAAIDEQIHKRADIPVTVIRQDAQGGPDNDLGPTWHSSGVKTLTTLPPGDLEQNLSRALVESLSKQIGVLPAGAHLDSQNRTRTVQVPAYAPRMTATLFSPGNNAKLEVISPTGEKALILEGRVRSATLERPAPGTWTLRMAEGDSAEVQADIVPLQVDIVTPASDVPVGRDLELTLRLGGAETIESLPQAPLYVGAVVGTATGNFAVQFSQGPDRLWHSTELVPIERAGEITIRPLIKAGSATVLDSTEETLPAVAKPYLVLENATTTAGQDLSFMLYREGHPVSPIILGQDPRAAVNLTIKNAGDAATDNPLLLNFDSKSWSIPASQNMSGHEISATLATQLSDGTTIQDTLTAVPVVNEPPLTARIHNALGVLLVACPVLALSALLWLAWLLAATRGRLRGNLVLVDPNGKSTLRIRVEGRRWQRTQGARTTKTQLVWAQGGRLWMREGLLPWPFDARTVGRDHAYLAERRAGAESSPM